MSRSFFNGIDLNGTPLDNALKVMFNEGSAPSTPASGKVLLYAKTDKLPYVKTSNGDEFPLANNMMLPSSGRLTLTQGTPATTADVTAATSIYWDNWIGEWILIYNGSLFVPYTSTGLSMALDSNSGHTGYHQSGKNFDAFGINDAGTRRLGSGPAWISSTARGTGAGTTELQRVKGIWTNANTITIRFGSASGDTVSVAANCATYLGSFRCSADGTTCDAGDANDTAAKRFLYNYYNQVWKTVRCNDTTNSWTHNSGLPGYRQKRASSINQIEVLLGMPGQSISLSSVSIFSPSIANTAWGAIGYDSASTIASGSATWYMYVPAGYLHSGIATVTKAVDLGYHYFAELECGYSGGTTTFYGDAGAAYVQTGMSGQWAC